MRSVLAFQASWCGPCQRDKPTLARLEKDGVVITRIDVDKQRDLATKHGIRSVPHYILLEDARVKSRTGNIQTVVQQKSWLLGGN